jgi:hypothetical protein
MYDNKIEGPHYVISTIFCYFLFLMSKYSPQRCGLIYSLSRLSKALCLYSQTRSAYVLPSG